MKSLLLTGILGGMIAGGALTAGSALSQVGSPEIAVSVLNRAIHEASNRPPEESAARLNMAFDGILAKDQITDRMLGNQRQSVTEQQRVALRESVKDLFSSTVAAFIGSGGDRRRSLSIEIAGNTRRLSGGEMVVPVRFEGQGMGLERNNDGALILIDTGGGEWKLIDVEVNDRSILAAQSEGLKSTLNAAGGDIDIMIAAYTSATASPITPVHERSEREILREMQENNAIPMNAAPGNTTIQAANPSVQPVQPRVPNGVNNPIVDAPSIRDMSPERINQFRDLIERR